MNTFRLTVMMCVFVVWIFLPTISYSSDYLLFFCGIEENKGWVGDLDTSGELTLLKEYTIGGYLDDISVSPNGRLAIIAGSSEPYLSCFFINKDGSINDPIYYNFFGDISYKRIVYNPFLPYGYIGTYPRYEKFKIDYDNKNISITTDTVNTRIPSFSNIGYSKWANCLVYHDSKGGFNRCIGTRNVLPDGSFSPTSHTLDLFSGSTNSDLAVSPDGRWAVTIGMGQPAMSVVGINRGGSLYLIQELSFDIFNEARNPIFVHFTPNGLYLIMLCDSTPSFILIFSVDQFTGRVTLMEKIGPSLNPPLGYSGGSAITPDGKYFLFTNRGVPGYPYGEQWYDIFRIEGNGKLTWLIDKKKVIKYPYSGDKVFVPPWREGYAPPFGWLVH